MNNENEEENWSNVNDNYVDDGSIAFSVGHQADALIGKAAKEKFNQVAAEILSEHPEFRLESVMGNPNAYGNTQPGYVIMVMTVPNTEVAQLDEQWPKFVEELEKRMPGIGLSGELRDVAGHLFVGEPQAGKGRRRSKKRAASRKRRGLSRKRRRTTHKRRS